MDVVAERVDASARVIERHYDLPDKFEEIEQRRRPYLGHLSFDENGGEGE